MRIRKSALKRIIKEELGRVLSEASAGSLFVERGGYGYIGLSDDGGNEWGLGQAISELLESGVTRIFQAAAGEDVESLFRLQSRDGEGVQGGMAHWDSDVFESYYNVDVERVILEFADLKNLEIIEAEDTTDQWNEYPEQDQADREAAWEEEDY